ncbi:hypothetical protein ACFYOT_12585 [Saccharothrix saharensis]|uniref:hypothetical protein n=1 Tax=Saccharothrix saharensis TaxID=571190 RepID=UPI0036ADC70E
MVKAATLRGTLAVHVPLRRVGQPGEVAFWVVRRARPEAACTPSATRSTTASRWRTSPTSGTCLDGDVVNAEPAPELVAERRLAVPADRIRALTEVRDHLAAGVRRARTSVRVNT